LTESIFQSNDDLVSSNDDEDEEDDDHDDEDEKGSNDDEDEEDDDHDDEDEKGSLDDDDDEDVDDDDDDDDDNAVKSKADDDDDDGGSDDDDAFPAADLFEEVPQNLPLRSQARLEILVFHRKSSAFGKLITYQQTLQLGLNAVKCSFSKVIHGTYKEDDDFWERLFSVIFYNCGDRRMMLVGKYMTRTNDSKPCF
jgi:hypothetical protein